MTSSSDFDNVGDDEQLDHQRPGKSLRIPIRAKTTEHKRSSKKDISTQDFDLQKETKRSKAKIDRLQRRLDDIAEVLRSLPQTDHSESTDSESALDRNAKKSLLALRREWAHRDSHIEFAPTEELPFKRGHILGSGTFGRVFKVTFKKVDLALKTIHLNQRPQLHQLREIDVLKSLNHRHIVDLIGTYYQNHELGLLTWPVATMDLRLFIELWEMNDARAMTHFLKDRHMTDDDFFAICESDWKTLYGCLASAVTYLHENNIYHKDIKPSNILLSPNGIWLTDFGSAKSFANDLSSSTEGGAHGTLRYNPPEVANFEKSGRSADVFSLGCVFLEVAVVSRDNGSLEPLAKLRPVKPGSYQANLDRLPQWLDLIDDRNYLGSAHALEDLRALIREMLDRNRYLRPSARQVQLRLASIRCQVNSSYPLAGDDFFCKDCTTELENESSGMREQLKEAKITIEQLKGSLQHISNIVNN